MNTQKHQGRVHTEGRSCENTMRRCHLQTKGEASEETKLADTLILEI